jgi:hypothetical protein
MSHFAALEVVIGLSFVYFVFSLVCSGITEWYATLLSWRAKMLEVALQNLFSGSFEITKEGQDFAARFWKHPLIQALQRPRHEKLTQVPASKSERAAPATDRNVKRPSYIPSRTFVAALLDLGARAHVERATEPGRDPPDISTVSLEQAINALPSAAMREAMLTLYRDADKKAQSFRKAAEQWFDDSMERVSGWYKRYAQRVLWATALALVVVFNIDTLQIGRTLWRDDAARAVIVNQAEQAAQQGQQGTNATSAAKALPIPLGWNLWKTGNDPGDIPTGTSILSKILGLLLSAAALTLGAPFWFDLLSKVVRVRGTGAPPPATDAVRHGEGEEVRAGEGETVQVGGVTPKAEPA